LWQHYLIYITTRILIQGFIQLTNNVAVAKWFVRLRGRAMSISNLGQRLGNGVTPLFTQFFVASYDWRVASIAIGLYTWALTVVPVFLWLKRQPEDMGLAPDGDDPNRATADPRAARQPSVAEHSYTLKQAVRSPVFWIIALTTAASVFVGAGINFNMVPLLTDRGIPNNQAVAVVSLWSLIGIPATLLMGYLGDRLPMRYLISVIYFGLAVGIFILARAFSAPAAYLFAIVHGLFFGGMLLLQNLIYADYFGRASLGTIRGVTTPIQMTCNAVGPLAATFVYDVTGSYTPILYSFIGLMALSGVVMVIAKPPLGSVAALRG
jgi:sugar phosphate permease